MKSVYKIYVCFYILFIGSVFGVIPALFAQEQASLPIHIQKFTHLRKWVEKHRCAPEIEKAIKGAKKSFRVSRVFKYDELPYYEKGADLVRFELARRSNLVKEEYKLDAVKIAEKCIAVQDDFLQIIAHEVKSYQDKSYVDMKENDRAVQQMEIFKKVTGFDDDYSRNVFVTGLQEVTIVDTGTEGFSYNGKVLLNNPKYDDSDIDFKKVQKEYKEYYESKF
ncbi:MAG: hypothetical protein ACXWL5_05245 [Candidatus Chromulinivorax sp.]